MYNTPCNIINTGTKKYCRSTCSLTSYITHITVCIGVNLLYCSFSTCTHVYRLHITIVHSRNTGGEPELIILWQYNQLRLSYVLCYNILWQYNVAQYTAFAYNMSQQCQWCLCIVQLNIKQLTHRHYRSSVSHLYQYQRHKTTVQSAHWLFHTWQVVGQLQLSLLMGLSPFITYLFSSRGIDKYTHVKHTNIQELSR